MKDNHASPGKERKNSRPEVIATRLNEKHPYRSPKTKVVIVKMKSILCTSPLGETNVTEMEEGSGNW